MLKDFGGFSLFAMSVEEVAVEVIRIEPVRRAPDPFLKIVPGSSRVAETYRESGDPIIKHAKSRRSASIHCHGVDLFDLLQDIACALCQLQSFHGAAIVACQGGLLTGDDSNPNNWIGDIFVLFRDFASTLVESAAGKVPCAGTSATWKPSPR